MRTIHRRRLMLLVAATALWTATACKDEDPFAPERRCDRPFTGSSLEGQWVLKATGTRRSCDDRRFEGDLEISNAMPVRVQTAAQETTGAARGPESDFEADAFVDRIERADFLVELADPPDGLILEGSATGSCFRVRIEEALPDGDQLRYDLDGFIVERGRARGKLTGTGPESCTSEANFTLDIL